MYECMYVCLNEAAGVAAADVKIAVCCKLRSLLLPAIMLLFVFEEARTHVLTRGWAEAEGRGEEEKGKERGREGRKGEEKGEGGVKEERGREKGKGEGGRERKGME